MRTMFLTALVLVGGCASAPPAMRPAPSHHAMRASAAEVARYAEHLLADNYAQDGPGAAVLVARGDEVLFRGARGMADVEHGTPLAADSLFEVASITKQFVAAGLLKLVESGAVSLDDPLSRYIADYPGGDAITLLELLDHTSGVRNYSDIPQLEELARKGIGTTQLIDGFKNEKPDFAPGTGWAYDNSGYILASAVIERVSGMPWYAYLQQALLKPLGLTHTGADPATAARRVAGYTLVDGKPTAALRFSSTQPYADGALVSNVDDLLRWNRALHKGHVLGAGSYRRMITPVGSAVPEQYALGLWHTTLRGREMIGHSGHHYGFSAYLLYLPGSDISVVVLQNMDRAPGVADPTESARKLAAFVLGDPYTAPVPVGMSASVLHQAEGVFGRDPPGPQEFSRQGARVLRLINGRLTAAHTGGIRSELVPMAPDTFQTREGFDRLQLVHDARGDVIAVRSLPWGEDPGLWLARTSGSRAHAQATLASAALERFAGTYSADGMEVHVYVDGGQLKVQPAGQPAGTLIYDSPGTFLVGEVDATVEFNPAVGTAQVAVLHQGKDTVEFKRKP
jgi:CubicO group peptidase (beta-lactamase class C family)